MRLFGALALAHVPGTPGSHTTISTKSSPVAPMQTQTYSGLQTIRVSFASEHVLHVELNRPRQLNSMNTQFWSDMSTCFASIQLDPNVRAVVLSGGESRHFTAGLDLTDKEQLDTSANDVARGAVGFAVKLKTMQDAFNRIESCDRPVIVAVHGACVGGGIDLISACDIRYCTKDSTFTVKEVDIGIAADLGTLQRLPKIVGNHSIVREWALTARFFPAQEALSAGLVSRVLDTKADLIAEALKTAELIASKSPIATLGTKHLLNYSRDHSVEEGLRYTAVWNAAMINTEDVGIAVAASLAKKKPVFSKL
ncbi:hypothetical protein BJ742DRAFT_518756 [Cladochytrium replicatum]|nr:hypothetical protein BJ742DRAFT_518756 [Cladochytrium replicatum]